MNLLEQGRRSGREAGKERAATLQQKMAEQFKWACVLFPALEDMDIAAMVRDYDRERLACEPDYTKFPEMRELIDRYIGEREGFREGSGLDETAAAFHFSWNHLLFKRVNAHYPAYWENVTALSQCTNVFFPEGQDGVTASDNRDINKYEGRRVAPTWRPNKDDSPWSDIDQYLQGAASSAIVMDEEPECSFPCDPDELCPPEAWDDVQVRVEFMTRYREFWGPANQIWIDRHLNAVAVEKTNCRVAFRYPEVAGAVCITACSYLDPEIHAFKQKRLRMLMATKGQTEADCPDWDYDLGSRLRNRRLCELTNSAAAKPGGPTIWDALEIVTDEAVPYPDRICLAGQDGCTWSFLQHAGVMSGPKRRWLYRAVEDYENPGSVTEAKLKLLLGEGVEMQPEWQADIDAGRCELAPELQPA
jgi:hypothetical protein